MMLKDNRRKQIEKLGRIKWNQEQKHNRKINATKNWFFEKINKINSPWLDSLRKIDTNKISNERGKLERAVLGNSTLHMRALLRRLTDFSFFKKSGGMKIMKST